MSVLRRIQTSLSDRRETVEWIEPKPLADQLIEAGVAENDLRRLSLAEMRKLAEEKGLQVPIERYVLVGRPSADAAAIIALMTEEEKRDEAETLSTFLGEEIDPAMIPRILLVQKFLQHEDDPNDRYPTLDIARFSLTNGLLFTMLYQAAAMIAISSPEPLAEAALGESTASALQNGESTPTSSGLSNVP